MPVAPTAESPPLKGPIPTAPFDDAASLGPPPLYPGLEMADSPLPRGDANSHPSPPPQLMAKPKKLVTTADDDEKRPNVFVVPRDAVVLFLDGTRQSAAADPRDARPPLPRRSSPLRGLALCCGSMCALLSALCALAFLLTANSDQLRLMGGSEQPPRPPRIYAMPPPFEWRWH